MHCSFARYAAKGGVQSVCHVDVFSSAVREHAVSTTATVLHRRIGPPELTRRRAVRVSERVLALSV